MATIIFVVLFLSFTNIFAYNPECEKESFCECSEKELYRHDFFISNKGVKFGINVKSWSDVKIRCDDISWKDVNFTRVQKIYKVDSVHFLNCSLPEETTLKDIVTKLGIIEKKRLSFISFRNLSESLKKEHFQGFSNVTELVLSFNYLINISYDFFRNFPNLRFLDLSENFLVLSNDTFNETLNLKQLDLHNTLLTTLPGDLLTDLENLEKIQLRYNGLRSLPENLFWGSTSLKYIDLSKNYLEELPELIFFDLIEIEYLLLSHNQIKILPDEVFKYLKYLKVLDLSYNRIARVQSTLLEGLKTLTELNMEGNGLIYIHSEAFSTNEQLSIAKFSNNSLAFSYKNEVMSPFYNNRRLKELHLANNGIRHFYSDWTVNKIELEILDLSHNVISAISANDFVFTSNKFVVDLRHNNITKILLTNIEMLVTYNTVKRNVIVHVEYNPILCDCHLYDLVRYSNGYMPSMVYNFFDLRLGNLNCVKPNGIQGPKIRKLDFKTYQCPEDNYFKIEKNCQTMCSCNIRPYDRMRVLDCSYRKISVFRFDKNKMNLKGNYPLTLNLTGNNLRFTPHLEYFKPFNLTHLLLSNNQITQLSVYTLPKTIQVLELHNNHLVKLSYDIIYYLYDHSYKKLTLSGNPFMCDCDARFLYVLILKMQDTYKDLKNVKCKGQNIPLVKMTVKQLCPSNDPIERFYKIV
ncbi:PREDICTED: protein toll-like [Polistes dominula]|uniref:Protein toll-like n=1 Tax=Polistes dominula TaxID=743375 RepID=A0ABM1JB71_POLDO|nr:PREDICTED: protein toll-like [Polistes dominula]